MKEFNVQNIKLEGKNLVEASAGTGKTFAIGILVIRLLLEKYMRIEQILIVTFTNAAVAELDIRIRKFLNESLQISKNTAKSPDPVLFSLVEMSIRYNGQEKTEKLLSNAILFLDETSVFTIHSFCQTTLTENAFDSGLLFNSEIIEDQSDIIEYAAQNYWRTTVTILDPEILRFLVEKDFSIELIVEVFKAINGGKKLRIKNRLQKEKIPELKREIENILLIAENELKNEIIKNWNLFKTLKLHKGTKLSKALDNGFYEDFYRELLSAIKDQQKDATNKLGFLIPKVENIAKLQAEYEIFKTDILSNYLNDAVENIAGHVEQNKMRNKVLSFQDLIGKLHNVLVLKANKVLKDNLNRKYKAVFIDEFQDTDNLQYEIFRTAFIEESSATLFFIGDPKQSIYGWRGADLRMYGEAKRQIGEELTFTMNINYRSTPEILDSINEFFAPDTIANKNKYAANVNSQFIYHNVTSANKISTKLLISNSPAAPFEIINNTHDNNKAFNKNEILYSAATEIAYILENGKFVKAGDTKKLMPRDIGVLVRSNRDAKEFKEYLNRYKIPAIIVDDTKVIETNEASELFYFLYAVLNKNNGNIARALLSTVTGFTEEQVSNLNFEVHHDIFNKFYDTWKNSGIFAVVNEFMDKYNVRNNLIFSNNPKGDRIYTNLLQLTQILNEKEIYDKFSPERLLDWYQKARQGEKSLNKYEQLLENDEDSVQIVTVHKSKGLEYKIVVLPYFNLTPEPKTIQSDKPGTYFISYKNDKDHMISFYWDEEEVSKYISQQTEENRRLLYVAITRAVHKCLVHYQNKPGILMEYFNQLDTESGKICYRPPIDPQNVNQYKTSDKNEIKYQPKVFKASIDTSWSITSYSAMDYTHKISKGIRELITGSNDHYENFIFNELEKGIQTGLLIHEIMEKISFSNDAHWPDTIKHMLNKYAREHSEEIEVKYLLLLHNTIYTRLHPLNFSLLELNSNKTFTELEFYFSFYNWNTSEINRIFPDTNLSGSDMKGLMHGFIDLVFEHDGKYYILDWKTNHLGADLDNYTPEKLHESINDNNYHLQFTIYTIAIKRYLEKKIKSFKYSDHFGGVLYLYVRGMRTGKKTGIYYTKPDKKMIDQLEKMIDCEK